MVVGVALGALVALPGCAPAGYNAADYGNAAEPASAVAASPTAGAPAAAAAGADPTAEPTSPADPVDANTPEISEELLTTELTAAAVKRMGKTVQDENGFVLYRFDDDTNKPAKSNCNGDCAKLWPPALTDDGEAQLKGVDAKLVGTVTRADGTKQLTLKGWPLYRYIGDKKAGQWKGQNVGGKWFVVEPDGDKNLTCLPPVSKPVALPADGAEQAGSDYTY